MELFEKKGLGTKLLIQIEDTEIDPEDIQEAFDMIDIFEKKYSRFIDGNFLSKINSHKTVTIDKELRSLIELSLKVSELSSGYFDITILPLLENIGYGIQKKHSKEDLGYKNIDIQGDTLLLKNNISIELGSVGKGYMVDSVYNLLEKKYKIFSLNFGGDIKIKGKQKIYLEDPLDDSKIIGEIEISDASIASSNPRKRQTKKGSHLVNPLTGTTTDIKKGVFTTHKLSSFSDIFATALSVTPLDMSKKILQETPGLEGMIIAENGEIYTSCGFKAQLYT